MIFLCSSVLMESPLALVGLLDILLPPSRERKVRHTTMKLLGNDVVFKEHVRSSDLLGLFKILGPEGRRDEFDRGRPHEIAGVKLDFFENALDRLNDLLIHSPEQPRGLGFGLESTIPRAALTREPPEEIHPLLVMGQPEPREDGLGNAASGLIVHFRNPAH